MTCDQCGQDIPVGGWPFCKDGHAPAKPNVISDELFNFCQENFGHDPEYFTSKKAMYQRADELNLRHTDRFPAWRGMVTEKRLRDVAALLSRGPVPPEHPRCETLSLTVTEVK